MFQKALIIAGLIALLAVFIFILGIYQCWWLSVIKCPTGVVLPLLPEQEQTTEQEPAGQSEPVVLTEMPISAKEAKVAFSEREIAFLEDSDIWVLSTDWSKKEKIIDTEEAIVDFVFSPDGREIYWLNGGGELWKQTRQGQFQVLVSEEEEMREEVQEGYLDYEDFAYTAGRVMDFYLSPDGNYIAYETLQGYAGCCMGPPDTPLTLLKIMRNDGADKVIVEKPEAYLGPLLRFDGWLPDSKHVLFHFTHLDTPTQGSPFFEVGVDGKNPELYSETIRILKDGVEINPKDFVFSSTTALTMETIGGKDPVYSPDGQKVISVKEWDKVRLKDIKTQATETILELKQGDWFPYGHTWQIVNWSEDSSFFVVRTQSNLFMLNKAGELFLEVEFENRILGKEMLFSLDNEYIAGSYANHHEQDGVIFFVDLTDKTKKEFLLPGQYGAELYPLFFTGSNKFYYALGAGFDISSLRAIDLNTWQDYLIGDGLWETKRTP